MSTDKQLMKSDCQHAHSRRKRHKKQTVCKFQSIFFSFTSSFMKYLHYISKLFWLFMLILELNNSSVTEITLVSKLFTGVKTSLTIHTSLFWSCRSTSGNTTRKYPFSGMGVFMDTALDPVTTHTPKLGLATCLL